MIVCICHRVSDRDIASAVRAGTNCFDMLQDDTGVASACGCCHDCARQVFDAARAKHQAFDGAASSVAGAMPMPMQMPTAKVFPIHIADRA